MTAIIDSKNDSRPELRSRTKKKAEKSLINFFMGTNSNGKHLEEALRQQIVMPGERLLGFFDGIFFDQEGARVGGMALNDYLIITDRHVILWARDQFKDYVDRFALANCQVLSTQQKDMLHGTIRLGLEIPADSENEAALNEQLEVIFDFVPLADLKQIADIIEVVSNVHRDLIKGGADESDRWEASWILFNQVFVNPEQTPAPAYQQDKSFSQVEFVPTEDFDADEIETLMTPLSRLDSLDRVSEFCAPPPLPHPVNPARLSASKTHGAADSGGSVQELEEELRWLNQKLAGDTYSASSRTDTYSNPRPDPAASSSAGPGTRLKQDLNPEGLYNIGRAGRAAWDGLDKLRREAEAKFEARGGIVTMMQTLRDSGMNLKDMTDFVVAINGLLETMNQSPAAREIAMTFLNRSSFLSGLGGQKGPDNKRPIPEVEEVFEDVSPGAGKSNSKSKEVPRMKVERRDKTRSNESGTDTLNPPRYKVAIRKKEPEEETPVQVVEAELKAPETFESEALTESAEEALQADVQPEAEAAQGSPLFTSKRARLKVRVLENSAQEINN
ncbi:MAG TPA: hypothetical protein VH186_02910 [Chloroflexia bacterium]|nr:hypothetical protein [Chloroflexia bacterium]